MNNRNTFDGYARYNNRSRDIYRTGWYGGSTLEYIRAHVAKSRPNAWRRLQIIKRIERGVVA